MNLSTSTGNRRGGPRDEAAPALLVRLRSEAKRLAHRFLDNRVRTRVDASDIAQETLLQALQAPDRLPQLDDSAWTRLLGTIARRRCIDVHRRHVQAARRTVLREVRGSVEGSGPGLSLAADSTAPDERASRAERARCVEVALQSLSASDRELLDLRHSRQLSVEEIAVRLHATPTAITTRHLRALQRLRRALVKSPGTREGGSP
jgi:RNA polymerase sigma-70 factor (ECF subfamily)